MEAFLYGGRVVRGPAQQKQCSWAGGDRAVLMLPQQAGGSTCEDGWLEEEAPCQRAARLKLRAAAAAGRHRALGQCILNLGLNLHGAGEQARKQQVSGRQAL